MISFLGVKGELNELSIWQNEQQGFGFGILTCKGPDFCRLLARLLFESPICSVYPSSSTFLAESGLRDCPSAAQTIS